METTPLIFLHHIVTPTGRRAVVMAQVDRGFAASEAFEEAYT